MKNETTTTTEQTVLTLAKETSFETANWLDAEPLILNQETYGCICCPETVLWYSFTATESAPLYAIHTSGDTAPVVELYDNTENLLNEGNTSTPLEISLICGETYYLRVSSNNGNTGCFAMTVSADSPCDTNSSDCCQSNCCDHNNCNGNCFVNTSETALFLDPDCPRTQRIDCPEAEHWYRFIPSKRGSYSFYVEGLKGIRTCMCSASGYVLRNGNESTDDLVSQIIATLEADHNYYFRLQTDGSMLGDYTVCIRETVWIDRITVTPERDLLKIGDTCHVNYQITPANATNKKYMWYSSASHIVSVDSLTGEITAESKGTATIGYIALDGSETTGSCSVTSEPYYMESIQLDETEVNIPRGMRKRIPFTILPQNATSREIHWSSSDPSVATVQKYDCFITAQGPGTATIVGTAKDGSGLTVSCSVSVYTPVESITIPRSMNIAFGDQKTLPAAVLPENATNRELRWCSSNQSVATVHPLTGVITTLALGTTTVYAASRDGSEVVASCDVKVCTPVPVTAITVSPSCKTLPAPTTELVS